MIQSRRLTLSSAVISLRFLSAGLRKPYSGKYQGIEVAYWLLYCFDARISTDQRPEDVWRPGFFIPPSAYAISVMMAALLVAVPSQGFIGCLGQRAALYVVGICRACVGCLHDTLLALDS